MLDVERSMTDGGPFPVLFGDLESVDATHFTDRLMAEVEENPDDKDLLATPSYW